MNSRNTLVTALFFLALLGLIVLELLRMVQSDRLYERFNRLEQRVDERLKQVTIAPTTSTQTSTGSDLRQANRGDWLISRFGAEPATLNPLTARDAYASIINGHIFETLMKYNLDTAELEPLLAESSTISDDGLTITFTLRDDIHFSDRTPITSADVIFTYETIMNPGIDAASLANFFSPIKHATAVDDRTVVFTLNEPYFKAFSIIAGMSILPQHIYAFEDPNEFNAIRSDLVGSGPYVFESWDVGREIALKRNNNYWNPNKAPAIDRHVYRIITNDLAALQSLQSGELDMLSASAEQYTEMCPKQDFTESFDCLKYDTPRGGYCYIGWNMARPWFADRDVRLAMTMLIDRGAIVQHLLKGLGLIATGPFYAEGLQADPDITPWPFDPVRAGELLDGAGWIDSDGDGLRDKDGKAFRFNFMIVSGSPLYEQLARMLKDQAAQAGIEVIIDQYEWSVFVERLNTRDFDATSLRWTGSIEGDPYQIWHSSQIEGRGSNMIGFANPAADALIEQARVTMDPVKRNALYHEFHRILHDQQPYTFLFSSPSLRFLDKRFENTIIHRLGMDQDEWYVPLALQKYK